MQKDAMPRTHILLAADARPEIGYGHLSRCTTLKTALEAMAATCTLTSEDPRVAARASGATVVVLDGYGWPERYADGLRSNGCKVVVIDDDARPPPIADLVVNPNAHAEQLPYDSPSLLGPRYAFIRPEFIPLRAHSRSYGDVRSVLVCMGGSDPDGVTPRVVEGALATLDRRTCLSVVLGPMCDADVAKAVAAVVARREGDSLVLHAPADFPRHLATADLAVLSGGVVLTEAIHLGLPSIALVIADNQRAAVSAWCARGAAIEAAPQPEEIADALGALLADASRRRRIGEAARSLVDGHGAERVAEAIMGLAHTARS